MFSTSSLQLPNDVEEIVASLEENSCFNDRRDNVLRALPDTLKFLNFWLLTEVRNKLWALNSDELKEVQKQLELLRQNVNISIRESMRLVRNTRSGLGFLCNVCGASVNLEGGVKNIWRSFQEHEHIEEQYVRFLTTKDAERFTVAGGVSVGTSNNGDTLLGLRNEHQDDGARLKPINYDSLGDGGHEPLNVSNSFSPHDKMYQNGGNESSSGSSESESNKSSAAQSNEQTDKASASSNKPDNSFRFNFHVGYDKNIEKYLYPSSLMVKIKKRDNMPEYTIQCNSLTSLYCLLCNCELPFTSDPQAINRATQNILIHAGGQKHLKFGKTVEVLIALKTYHSNWMALEAPYQAHQIYFHPVSHSDTYCYLCKTLVPYGDLIKHVKCEKHKTPLFALWKFIEGREACNYISCKQAEVYGIPFDNKYTASDSEAESEESVLSTSQKTSPDENASAVGSASSPVKKAEKKDNSPKHSTVPSVLNPNSGKVLDLLEKRFSKHLLVLKLTGEVVRCSQCSVNLVADVNVIRNHVLDKEHCRLAEITNKKYTYHCEICNVFYQAESKWQQHLTLPAHKNKCQNLGASRREKLKEYHCISCNYIIFGDELSLSRHQKRFSFKAKKKEVKLPEAVKMLFRSEMYMNEFAGQLVNEANFVTSSGQDVLNCCAAIEEALSELYENCKAYPFGSRVSGLGNELSDLDVFVDVGDMYTGQRCQDAASQEEFVKKSSKVFRKLKNVFASVNPIPTARTPIVQVYHKVYNIDCDLSFRHGLSVENTKFLRKCIEIQPMVRYLILILKKWSSYTNLSEHITTYALSMMVIFYMQINGHLLSVKELRTLNPSKSVIINGWETIKYTATLDMLKLHIRCYDYSLIEGLMNFFKFYSDFNYATDVVCPLMGHVIKKSAFQTPLSLPQEMFTYVKKLETDREPEHFRMASPLCIQDPFDLSHNLTKACQQGTIDRLKKLCDLTYKHLASLN